MRFPRTVAATAATIGLVLSVLAPACSGVTRSPEQAPTAASSEATPDLAGPAATALFEGARSSEVSELVDLGTSGGSADPALTATAAELDATIQFWADRAEADPRDFVALNNLGGYYIRRARLTGDVSDFARARTAFEQSVDSNRTRNLGGLIGLAHIGVFTHQFEDARDLATEALAIKPDKAYARWILGDAQLALGEYDDAYTTFTDPIALNDTLPAHSRLAFIEALRGNLAGAELQWQLAIAADTGRQPEETAWVHTQTGNFYLASGRIEEARAQFDLALDVVPGDLAALAGHAHVAITLGQLNEAVRIFEYLVEQQPLTEYAVTLGELYEATGRPDRARQQYDLVLAIDQVQQAAGIATDLQVARYLVAHGDDADTALDAAERAYEARPGIEAADTLARAHLRLGNLEAAERYSDEALSVGGRPPALLATAGLIAHARGDLDAAASLLAEVQAINPRYSVAEAPLVAATLEAIELAQAQVASR